MATIILNGVTTDTNLPLSATPLNDKLTVSGGLNDYEANLLAGSDLVEIDQAGENVSATTIKGGDDDDSISVDSSGFSNVSSDITLSGGNGNDTIEVGCGHENASGDDVPVGMVTLTGKINGNDGDDSISVVRADDAILQGGTGDDNITLGYYYDLDGPGSRGNTTFDDTSVNGGSGDDFIEFESSVKATDTTVNGGDGEDTLYVDGSLTGTIEINAASSANFIASSISNTGDGNDEIYIGYWGGGSDVSLTNTIINGNGGADLIQAYGPFAEIDGSIIAGGGGHDTISVADAGALTVRGGAGKDLLRVGSGQTVTGGPNADIFSIESAGGATIQDFDAIRTANGATDNCFCSDVIQVDGNKINYDTYIYKQTTDKYTSASSYAGNIKVKAFEQPVADTCTVNVATQAIKTATLSATAIAKYKVTKTDTNWVSVLDLVAGMGQASFPSTFDGKLNGNFPRPTNDVNGLGYGYGEITGVIGARGVETLTGGTTINYRSVLLPNLTVYTSNKFEKGDFSFLNEAIDGTCKVTVSQKLLFDDVTRGTITNHWVDFGFSKDTDSRSLYDLKFGTANFTKITTGRANLVITKGLVDKTYYPTPDQITNDALSQDGINATVTQTAGGNYVYSRKNTATANAGASLALSSMPFDLYTKRNSGLGVEEDRIYRKSGTLNGENIFVDGSGTADGGYIYYPSLTWYKAQGVDLLTLTVATQVTGSVVQPYTPGMNVWAVSTAHTMNDPANTKPSHFQNAFIYQKQYFQGKTAAITDTRTAEGSLIAKIAMGGADLGKATAQLTSWLGRAQIKGEQFTPTDCFFDNPLTPEYIADGVGGNQHNMWTPASISKSNKGEFGHKYLWTSGGHKLNSEWSYYSTTSEGVVVTSHTHNPIVSLPYSNGCTSQFSCSGTTRINAKDAIFGFNGLGTTSGLIFRAGWSSNNAFFSASKFTPVALAAEGMGDNAVDAKGAPFRVLFFDNAGSDNGLYVMSGTANYKNGDVTALNTNTTAPSGMGGKETIVKVTGGKGYEISLSDINFV